MTHSSDDPPGNRTPLTFLLVKLNIVNNVNKQYNIISHSLSVWIHLAKTKFVYAEMHSSQQYQMALHITVYPLFGLCKYSATYFDNIKRCNYKSQMHKNNAF